MKNMKKKEKNMKKKEKKMLLCVNNKNTQYLILCSQYRRETGQDFGEHGTPGQLSRQSAGLLSQWSWVRAPRQAYTLKQICWA